MGATAFQRYQNRYGNPAAQPGVQQVESLPAPVGGWNARDSYANMDPMDAVQLTNLWPNVSNVQLRGGSTTYSTGLSGTTQTLIVYNGAATSKMYGATSAGDIYDVTAGGAVGAAVVSGKSGGYWEYSNMTTAGGNYLVAVNGLDKLLLFDGTTWTPIDGASTPAITGVTTSTLWNVTLFKHRLWFLQKNTLKAWYLLTDSIAGAASAFDLSAIAQKGGYLVDVGTWTLDAGYGVDDNLVFITSQGEVIVYAGTDPASASTFSLIGVWQLGAPIGRRCMMKWSGDLLILTFDGLLPLASALQSSRLDPRVALSDKIQAAISAATDSIAGPSATGWELCYFAKQNALWINVPTGTTGTEQYAMNTITKSWCNFTNWNASTWCIFNDYPYFGSTGTVVRAWDTTYADNGTLIVADGLQAFNYFQQRAVKKYFTRTRPSIASDGFPAIGVGMNIDFDTSDTTAPLTFVPASFSQWDVGTWDNALWGQGLTTTNTWLGVTGIGYCGGVHLKSSSMGNQIQWSSTDVVYQLGWAGV